MNYQVQTAIIGAGPAGAACGITLQRRGISNCLLDRAVFPREKTCGGLVTWKTLQLVRDLLGDDPGASGRLFCNKVKDITVFDRDTPVVGTSIKVPFYLTERSRFDYALVQAYLRLGGRFFEGQKRYEIDDSRRRILLSDGGIIHYKTLVYADGALTRARRDFAIPKQKLGFCVETFLPPDAMKTRGLELHFGIAKDGYLWVFPYGSRIGVGLGCTYRKGIPYAKMLKVFLRKRGLDCSNIRIQGAFVPFGHVTPQKKIPKHVMLIGDAGGFVDSVHGEGLYFALYSGTAAAKAMMTPDPGKNFRKSMRPAVRIIESGRRSRRLLFRPAILKKLIPIARGREYMLKVYCDYQISGYHNPFFEEALYEQ